MKLELKIHGYGNGPHYVHVITNLPHQDPPILTGWVNGTINGGEFLWGDWSDRNSPGEAMRKAFLGISNLLATVETQAPSRQTAITVVLDVVESEPPEPHECTICGDIH